MFRGLDGPSDHSPSLRLVFEARVFVRPGVEGEDFFPAEALESAAHCEMLSPGKAAAATEEEFGAAVKDVIAQSMDIPYQAQAGILQRFIFKFKERSPFISPASLPMGVERHGQSEVGGFVRPPEPNCVWPQLPRRDQGRALRVVHDV